MSLDAPDYLGGRNNVFTLETPDGVWACKPYRRLSFAHDAIAHGLARILKFDNVMVPEPCRIRIADRYYEATRYLSGLENPALEDGRQKPPVRGTEGLLINLLMGKTDGNWHNVMVDGPRTVLVDFEQAGFFYRFKERFLEKPEWSYRISSAFLAAGDTKRIENGIRRIKEAVLEGSLSFNALRNVATGAGLSEDEADYYAAHIVAAADDVESFMSCILAGRKAGGAQRETSCFFPFELNDGRRCGAACVRMVLRYFGHDAPSLSDLDGILRCSEKEHVYLAQLAAFLHRQGFDVRYALKEDRVRAFNEGREALLRRVYPESANSLIRHLPGRIGEDLAYLVSRTGMCGPVDSVGVRAMYGRDCAILCSLDARTLYGESGLLQGHHLFLTGIGHDVVTAHNCGPKNAGRHRRFGARLFWAAVERLSLFDYGVLAVVPPYAEKAKRILTSR